MKEKLLIKGSKKRLKNIADKKFNRCFIFPLSEFETVFGSMWGHGLTHEELTSEQKIYRAKWVVQSRGVSLKVEKGFIGHKRSKKGSFYYHTSTVGKAYEGVWRKEKNDRCT